MTNIRTFILIYIISYIFFDTIPIEIGSLEVTVGGFMNIFVLVGFFIYFFINSDFRIKFYKDLKSQDSPSKAFLYWLAVIIISVFLAQQKFIGIVRFLNLSSAVFLFFIIISCFYKRRHINLLINSMVVAAIIMSIPALIQLMFSTSKFLMDSTVNLNSSELFRGAQIIRVGGIYSKTRLAYLLNVFLPFLIVMFISVRSGFKKIFLFLLIVVMFVLLVNTYTRSAWLGFLIGILFIFIYYRKKLSLVILAIPIFSTILIFIPFVLLRLSLDRIIIDLGTRINNIWAPMLKSIAHSDFLSVLFGKGLGNFSFLYYRLSGTSWAAHNTFVTLIVETGLIGLGAFLLLLYSTSKSIYTSLSKKKFTMQSLPALAFMAAFVAMIIEGFVENLFRGGTEMSYLFILAAIFVANKKLHKKNISSL
ncbi:MAG: O-antigen ligase family protein [Candidatus Helarchaeota archaeon]